MHSDGGGGGAIRIEGEGEGGGQEKVKGVREYRGIYKRAQLRELRVHIKGCDEGGHLVVFAMFQGHFGPLGGVFVLHVHAFLDPSGRLGVGGCVRGCVSMCQKGA